MPFLLQIKANGHIGSTDAEADKVWTIAKSNSKKYRRGCGKRKFTDNGKILSSTTNTLTFINFI